MSGNYSSSAYGDISPCHTDTEECYLPFVYINDGINFLSILLNILHLIILNQMEEIKATKYFWILMNFSISDILYSCISSIYFSCRIKQAILHLHTQTAYWISKLIMSGVAYRNFSQIHRIFSVRC